MALMSKFKDPPRYEDAVKQTRCRQTAMQVKQTIYFFFNNFFIVIEHLLKIVTLQVPTTLSQHMDDLFDVLIESGGKKRQYV